MRWLAVAGLISGCCAGPVSSWAQQSSPSLVNVDIDSYLSSLGRDYLKTSRDDWSYHFESVSGCIIFYRATLHLSRGSLFYRIHVDLAEIDSIKTATLYGDDYFVFFSGTAKAVTYTRTIESPDDEGITRTRESDNFAFSNSEAANRFANAARVLMKRCNHRAPLSGPDPYAQ